MNKQCYFIKRFLFTICKCTCFHRQNRTTTSVLKVHIEFNKRLVYSSLVLVRIIRHISTPTNYFVFGRHYCFLLPLFLRKSEINKSINWHIYSKNNLASLSSSSYFSCFSSRMKGSHSPTGFTYIYSNLGRDLDSSPLHQQDLKLKTWYYSKLFLLS